VSNTKMILTPDQAESLLPPGEQVHCLVNPPWGFVACNSPRKHALRRIRDAKLIEIGGERAKRMKHALIVYAREGGYTFFATDMEKVEALEQRLLGAATFTNPKANQKSF
jgi:hypothetical protein